MWCRNPSLIREKRGVGNSLSTIGHCTCVGFYSKNVPQSFPEVLVCGIFSFAQWGEGAQLVSGFLAEGITPCVAGYWCVLGSRGVQKTPRFLLWLIFPLGYVSVTFYASVYSLCKTDVNMAPS